MPEIAVAPPPAPAEIVTAFPAWERVMLFPPASVTVPDDMSARAPEVLPARVMLIPPPAPPGGAAHDLSALKKREVAAVPVEPDPIALPGTRPKRSRAGPFPPAGSLVTGIFGLGICHQRHVVSCYFMAYRTVTKRDRHSGKWVAQDPEKLFWRHVQITSRHECWEWQASLWSTGYGRFHIRGKPWKAHRAAWLFLHGDIPDGLCVLHKCDNRKCVNPHHLWLGTIADNDRDRDAKGRHHHPSHIGERNPRAKLSANDVREIRRRHAAGLDSLRALGNEFDVPFTHISRIVNRKAWSHI